MLCRVCGGSQDNRSFVVREMMFGLGDEFTYFECSVCGCLQIAGIPDNMEKYYPPGYYSFQAAVRESVARRLARISRDRYVVFGTGVVGRLLSGRYGHAILEVFGFRRPGLEDAILDVGCGSGGFLRSLADLGFKRLSGVDPYIAGEVADGPVRISKKTILDLPDDEKFDFIFFNHSLEHVWNHDDVLAKASRLLTPKGCCVIGIPLKTDVIWSLYGVNWVQIDAPRHFHLHTMTSFRRLASQAGLEIKQVVFDSGARQFWGSEQYMRGIPLQSGKSYGVNPRGSMFSAKQIREFEAKARELNRTSQGDQAAFCLEPQHTGDRPI